ncbi:MAG: 2-dehydro-3-deoxygalactonokinase [Roseovarius sp.]
MTGWIALGRAPDGVRACAMQDGRLTEQVTAGTEAAALGKLSGPTDRIVRIGDGAPASLPAPVLPGTGRGLPGFSQKTPADVIGGWVRLWLAGFLAKQPGWDGVIAATEGPVSHWIHISAGEAVSSQSFLTPRLTDALGGAETPDADAMADSLSRPERLAAHLRAAEVSGNMQALTGHLVGAELAAARAYWLGQQVAVIAPPPAPVATALKAQSVPCDTHTPDDLLAPGLSAIGKALGL